MPVLKNWIFWAALILLLLHQWIEKILHYSIPIFDNYLDTLLCMPILLGTLLWERRNLFKLGQNFSFSFPTVVIITFIAIIIFEVIFPYLSPQFTADWIDGIMYCIGSLIFYFFINR